MYHTDPVNPMRTMMILNGKDNYLDSMLDFVFLANGARAFECQCSIVQRDGDFPDDATTSDHRATELWLNLN